MSLINHEELKKQLASGEITSLDDITAEFKNILKEVIQTATQEELTSHLGYERHQESTSSNARNGYNEKTINSKYGQFDVSIPRDRDSSFAPQGHFLTLFTAPPAGKKARNLFRWYRRSYSFTLYQRYECKGYTASS